ncbi:chromosome partitioning protein, ParB family [Lachnospiraceae bacterium KH1T2]|nr:chromosome partitioning protein, ParB family [Lachnospiraceae bacterium KH1T2]
MARKALGKGIDILIKPGNKEKNNDGNMAADGKALELNIGSVEPDRNQPRKNFSEDELNDLADSIRKHGIIQPLLVEKTGNHYTIVAGERRWRAAKIAGLKKVPVILGEYSDQEKMEIQLIENIQREKLNPIEEAKAYKRLIEEFQLKQDDLAESIGKNRTTITNTMRLLNLDERVQEMLIEEKLSPGHARALLAIEDKELQYEMASKVFDEKLSVRETEKLVKNLAKPEREKFKPAEAVQLIYNDMEEKFRNRLGTKVKILPKNEKKGRIEIEYYSQDELENIFDKIVK